MARWDDYGLDELLANYPKLQLKEESREKLVVEGQFDLINAQMEGFDAITESIHLRIEFPGGYSKEIPKVIDLDGKIPKNPDHHINVGKDDASFCLGSGIKVLDDIAKDTSLCGFLENTVRNYLYRIFYKIKHGVVPGDELPHYEEGLVQDYENIFGINGEENISRLVKALGYRKRVANKLKCPCGCTFRLGKCDFRLLLPEWRSKAPRSWYRNHWEEHFKPALKSKKKHAKTNLS
ncbi:MAG: hypothetical protein COA78_14570 [Blastopirellula sp.]|nr:MAG: hypothetical protein COA78_14570 [Blastopirellula sp.]